MIYTRFGTPVTVVGGDFEKGEVTILGSGTKPDEPKEVWTSDLRADDGINEIAKAIEDANA